MISNIYLIAICCTFATSAYAQFYHQNLLGLPQASAYDVYGGAAALAPRYQYTRSAAAPHPSVVRNAQWESQLPPELLKSSRFYSNPHIAAGLAQESLLTDKEMAVVNREAEKIPREQVYKLFKNAGYLNRR